MTNNELTRANKVTVKVNEDTYEAIFYRTHKVVNTVLSTDAEVDWTPIDDMTKTGNRETFRAYVIENAEKFGVLWKPEDMRSPSNIRKAIYMDDDSLIDDAMTMVIPGLRELTEKCKYGIEWGGISFESITPLTQTSKGTDLGHLGIENGKYRNRGNWAWADILFTVTLKYNKEEIYVPIHMQLVSGQLKKCKITITSWTEMIRDEIISANLATAEQLDPPKEDKSKNKNKKSKNNEEMD